MTVQFFNSVTAGFGLCNLLPQQSAETAEKAAEDGKENKNIKLARCITSIFLLFSTTKLHKNIFAICS
jgi:hypothetical protein